MGVSINPLEQLAKSKTGTKFFKWAASEKGMKFLNENTPQLETVLATSCYVYATEKQKNLNRREKNVLQWQNVIPAIIGIAIGAWINRKVGKFGEQIIKNVDAQKVPDIHKIVGAIRVATPIFSTCLLMRYITPVATAFASGEIEEYRNKKKLDIKA